MKLFFFILSLKFLVFGTLFSQSYWFGGLTRMPAPDGEGTTASVYFNYQSHSIDQVRATTLNDGISETGELSILGFSGFALGAEGAWEKKYFALEGGIDLGIAGMDSEVIELDDNYLAFAGKIGPMLKYEFKVSDDLSIIPFIRGGFLLEMATNDLALLAYSLPNANSYYNNYSYTPLGDTFLNIFANYSVGSSVVWNNWTAGLELGKYQVVGGDFSPEDNDAVFELPDPLFLRLSVGHKFSSGTLLFGYRMEFWDDTIFFTDDFFGPMSSNVEWAGHAFDISFQGSF